MRYLLDTNAMLWWIADSPELSPPARTAIADPRHDLAYSVVGLWEIAVKASIGKLADDVDVRSVMLAQGFGELAVLGEHALAVRDLPWHHRDPFDRMLVVQARIDGRTLITADRRLAAYDVRVLDARSP